MNFAFDLLAALTTCIFVISERRGFGLQAWRLLLANFICNWFFQWSSLHALERLPLSVVSGLNSTMNPIFGAIFATLLLAERPTCWFGVVLLRNVLVIWLMLYPMATKTGGIHEHFSQFRPILWTVLLALSNSSSYTMQRILKGVSPLAIVF